MVDLKKNFTKGLTNPLPKATRIIFLREPDENKFPFGLVKPLILDEEYEGGGGLKKFSGTLVKILKFKRYFTKFWKLFWEGLKYISGKFLGNLRYVLEKNVRNLTKMWKGYNNDYFRKIWPR